MNTTLRRFPTQLMLFVMKMHFYFGLDEPYTKNTPGKAKHPRNQNIIEYLYAVLFFYALDGGISYVSEPVRFYLRWIRHDLLSHRSFVNFDDSMYVDDEGTVYVRGTRSKEFAEEEALKGTMYVGEDYIQEREEAYLHYVFATKNAPSDYVFDSDVCMMYGMTLRNVITLWRRDLRTAADMRVSRYNTKETKIYLEYEKQFPRDGVTYAKSHYIKDEIGRFIAKKDFEIAGEIRCSNWVNSDDRIILLVRSRVAGRLVKKLHQKKYLPHEFLTPKNGRYDAIFRIPGEKTSHPISILSVEDDHWYTSLLLYTGDIAFNQKIFYALHMRDLRISPSGITHKDGQLFAHPTSEQEIFAYANLMYIEPQRRETKFVFTLFNEIKYTEGAKRSYVSFVSSRQKRLPGGTEDWDEGPKEAINPNNQYLVEYILSVIYYLEDDGGKTYMQNELRVIVDSIRIRSRKVLSHKSFGRGHRELKAETEKIVPHIKYGIKHVSKDYVYDPEVAKVFSMTPKMQAKLWSEGIRTVDDLMKLDYLPDEARVYLNFREDIRKPIPLNEIQDLTILLREVISPKDFIFAGAYRRGRESNEPSLEKFLSNKIILLVKTHALQTCMNYLISSGYIYHGNLSWDGNRYIDVIKMKSDTFAHKIEIRPVVPPSWITSILLYTGNHNFNEQFLEHSHSVHKYVTEHCIVVDKSLYSGGKAFSEKLPKYIFPKNEREIFEKFELEYVPPTGRNWRMEAEDHDIFPEGVISTDYFLRDPYFLGKDDRDKEIARRQEAEGRAREIEFFENLLANNDYSSLLFGGPSDYSDDPMSSDDSMTSDESSSSSQVKKRKTHRDDDDEEDLRRSDRGRGRGNGRGSDRGHRDNREGGNRRDDNRRGHRGNRRDDNREGGNRRGNDERSLGNQDHRKGDNRKGDNRGHRDNRSKGHPDNREGGNKRDDNRGGESRDRRDKRGDTGHYKSAS